MKIALGIIFIIALSGRFSRGDLKNPLDPIGALKNHTKQMATVKFYRTTPLSGSLEFIDICVDYNKKQDDKFLDPNKMMCANRDIYMSKEIKPGVYAFSLGIGEISKQTVNLKAGFTYYLAITFTALPLLNGLAGLQFKTKSDFIKETKGDKEIYFTGECNAWSGCDYEVIK